MLSHVPLFPEQASTMAAQTDALLYFLLAVSAFFSVLIGLTVVFFAIKYRRRSELDRPARVRSPLVLEVVWIAIPFGLAMIMFAWGARLYVQLKRPPDNATEVFVVGKQWMWKIQHMEGVREINELHVPVGRPIKLTMTSEDVIHSFFVPAFRIKQDVLPGRLTTAWFQATKIGTYHLFCSQYCGTDHARMIGQVIVMEPSAYDVWLSGSPGVAVASIGEKLFQEMGCVACHRITTPRGPSLVGLYGQPVRLQNGTSVTADDAYLLESIVDPQAKIVADYEPIMPTYKGLVSEQGLLQLIAYIKSLQKPEVTPGPVVGAAAQGSPTPSPREQP